MDVQSPLEALVQPAVEAAGFRLVRFRVTGGKRKTLQIMAERADGQMDVEDCAKLSRELSGVLEAADPIEGDYVLEVSSPGIDRPLTQPDDYLRFVEHEARVELKNPKDGRKRFKGRIAGVEPTAVVMEVVDEKGKELQRFAFDDIAEAKLVLTDKLIEESLKAKEGAKGPH